MFLPKTDWAKHFEQEAREARARAAANGPTAEDVRAMYLHTLHFGVPAVVRKLGRGWIFAWGDWTFPTIFKTKRAAVDQADATIAAMCERFGIK